NDTHAQRGRHFLSCYFVPPGIIVQLAPVTRPSSLALRADPLVKRTSVPLPSVLCAHQAAIACLDRQLQPELAQQATTAQQAQSTPQSILVQLDGTQQRLELNLLRTVQIARRGSIVSKQKLSPWIAPL